MSADLVLSLHGCDCSYVLSSAKLIFSQLPHLSVWNEWRRRDLFITMGGLRSALQWLQTLN